MKVFTVVGIRASGKTTTVTQLAQEFTRRGYRVGTVKSIFCPTFSIDSSGSNTFRHSKAGAQIICAKAKAETALIFPRAMAYPELLSHYKEMDIVILEGDYLAPVPRLVAAHREEDASPRINGLTLALTGKIANGQKEALGLPAFNPLCDVQALADFLEKSVPTTVPEAVDGSLPHVPGVTGDGFCQCGCKKHLKGKGEKKQVTAYIDGQEIPLTAEQEKYLLSLQGK